VPKVFSKQTLERFEAASASIPLRPLDRAFDAAGLRLGKDPGGPEGARRAQFRRYIAGVDQHDPKQLDRLGGALGALIDEVAESKKEYLVKAAEGDGFTFADGVFRPAATAPSSVVTSQLARFPGAVPEIPVSNVETAAEYYVKVLGFQFDWGNDEGGIGGISRGDCRLYLTNRAFHEHYGTRGPVTVWLNLYSKDQIDELHRRWKLAGAKILAKPKDQPWNLREFRAADLDGNQLRVFYDFAWELNKKKSD
jgi:predicted enzyme related to lactoylglutathione lyase